MTRIKIILWAALLTVMLASCSLLIQEESTEEDNFWAQNTETGEYYQVRAEMLYEGKKCVIWAEKDAQITQQTAKEIANEYDVKIRPKITETFSMKNIYIKDENDKTYHFNDMLDFANWIAGGKDGKLTILLLDIKDGYPAIDSYVAGYFYGGNFYKKGNIPGTRYYSNGRDMIYVDTYPGLGMDPRQTYATFAHELQHLINFVTTVLLDRDFLMDTWIDEGLSSQAEYLYLGENPSIRYEWFNEDKAGTIAKGNNFFVWDNHSEEPLAILDDYATVYLFFRWLYLQNTGLQSHIFLDIETSAFHDYRAIIDTVKNIDHNKPEWDDDEKNPAWKDNWKTLFMTWLAANYYPTNSYGYTGDPVLQTITVKPVAGSTILLYPGEGVYSNSTSGTSGSNIRHAGIAENTPTINTSSPYTGDVLLTFNANTDNRSTAAPEAVTLTNVSPPVSQAARTIQTGTLTGPYVIDARDMLNKNKKR